MMTTNRVERGRFFNGVVRQFATFAGLGAMATGVQYAILIALVQLFGTEAMLASSLGFIISAIGNYALNRRFTFGSRESHLVALPKFAVVAGVGLLLNGVVLSVLVGVGTFYLVAQIAATCVVLCWNFVLHRCWTFRLSSSNTR
jgi:putative flippase GtrA